MATNKQCRRLVMSLLVVLSFVVLNAQLTLAADPGKNGKIAFFANLTGTTQIYTTNPDGTNLFQVTNLPPTTNGFAFSPDFSPDGKSIVFAHDMTGALELYTINPDGTGLTQITHDGLAHAVPRWSPDRSHLLFATVGKYDLAVIATVRADGTDLKLLTTPVWDSLGASYTPHLAVQRTGRPDTASLFLGTEPRPSTRRPGAFGGKRGNPIAINDRGEIARQCGLVGSDLRTWHRFWAN